MPILNYKQGMSGPLCMSELDHALIPLLGSRVGGKCLKLKNKESFTFESMHSPSLDGDSLGKAKGLKTREFCPFLGSLCLYTSTKARLLNFWNNTRIGTARFLVVPVRRVISHPVDCSRDLWNVLRAVTEIRLQRFFFHYYHAVCSSQFKYCFKHLLTFAR